MEVFTSLLYEAYVLVRRIRFALNHGLYVSVSFGASFGSLAVDVSALEFGVSVSVSGCLLSFHIQYREGCYGMRCDDTTSSSGLRLSLSGKQHGLPTHQTKLREKSLNFRSAL